MVYSIYSSWSEWKGGDSWGNSVTPETTGSGHAPGKRPPWNGDQRVTKDDYLTLQYGGKYMMELADVRNALENTATKLADFRGSL